MGSSVGFWPVAFRARARKVVCSGLAALPLTRDADRPFNDALQISRLAGLASPSGERSPGALPDELVLAGGDQ